jgi:hypothetical protein
MDLYLSLTHPFLVLGYQREAINLINININDKAKRDEARTARLARYHRLNY